MIKKLWNFEVLLLNSGYAPVIIIWKNDQYEHLTGEEILFLRIK